MVNQVESESKEARRRKAKIRKLARQLVALRQFCTREGLGESLQEAEKAFGITEATLNTWSEVVESVTEKQRVWLELLAQRSNPLDGDQLGLDWALRINTWLFQVLEAHPEYVDLHRRISAGIFQPPQYVANASRVRPRVFGREGDWEDQQETTDGNYETPNKAEGLISARKNKEWRREISRYWFLDDTMANLRGEDSRSLIPETEATFDYWSGTRISTFPWVRCWRLATSPVWTTPASRLGY